jgi:hypothetical protein
MQFPVTLHLHTLYCKRLVRLRVLLKLTTFTSDTMLRIILNIEYDHIKH